MTPIGIALEVYANNTVIDFGVESNCTDIACGVDSPVVIRESDIPAYEGDYNFTPSESAQEIQIVNHRATQNIVINPIPSNYGLITWNGTTLKVE